MIKILILTVFIFIFIITGNEMFMLIYVCFNSINKKTFQKDDSDSDSIRQWVKIY